MCQMKLLLLLSLMIGCSQPEKKVYLIKQWHLSSETPTSDIEKAKTLPQYPNQRDIYDIVKRLIDQKKSQVLLAEGCEGEVKADFPDTFNSWNMKNLGGKLESPDFADIMAPVWMKIKLKKPGFKVLCGDNSYFIQQNLKAFSDMRGYFGFYQRLVEAKNTGKQKKYQAYAKQLRSLFPRKEIDDVEGFALNKLKESVGAFEQFVKNRNESFLKQIKSQLGNNPMVVIGGLHIQDLVGKLKQEKIDFEVITPKGYQNNARALIDKLKETLQIDVYPSLIQFLMPENFQLAKFKTKAVKDVEKMLSPSELKTLEPLLAKSKLPLSLLTSDFDQDGVRDFTFSTGDGFLVISPEDSDWDNDGVENLVDEDLGGEDIAKMSSKTPLANNYLSQADTVEVVKRVRKHVRLIQAGGSYHEFLVLQVLDLLIQKVKLPMGRVKFLRAAPTAFSYGRNAFFNYVKHLNTLNYDPANLNKYINDEYQNRYKGADYKTYINSYIIPLLVHSLAHEIAHSLEFDYEDLAKSVGWTWKEAPVKSNYLKEYRHEDKKIVTMKEKLQFKGQSFKQWNLEFTKYEQEMQKIFKIRKLAGQKAKQSKYFSGVSSEVPEHKLSFLKYHQLVSLYSCMNPDEWFAETYAMCIFRRVYPQSKNLLDSVQYEHTLGIFPIQVDDRLCLSF